MLNELKTLITKPPVLASPETGETLLLYLAATIQVISVGLLVVQEEPGHVLVVRASSCRWSSPH
jgi:hypothetical protein